MAFPRGWIEYARDIEQAGADAIELNIYSLVTDPARTASEVEKDYCDLVRTMRESRGAHCRKDFPFFQCGREFRGSSGLLRGERFGALQPVLPARS